MKVAMFSLPFHESLEEITLPCRKIWTFYQDVSLVIKTCTSGIVSVSGL